VYLWNDPADSDKMKEQMEIAAAKVIAAAAPPAKAAPKPHTATTAAQRHKAAAAAAPSQTGVLPTSGFKAYELTYSGGATLVFTGERPQIKAGKVKYVTVIAPAGLQRRAQGAVQVCDR